MTRSRLILQYPRRCAVRGFARIKRLIPPPFFQFIRNLFLFLLYLLTSNLIFYTICVCAISLLPRVSVTLVNLQTDFFFQFDVLSSIIKRCLASTIIYGQWAIFFLCTGSSFDGRLWINRAINNFNVQSNFLLVVKLS